MLSCAHVRALPRRFPCWTESGVGGLEEAPRTRQGKAAAEQSVEGLYLPLVFQALSDT